ncbi:hypothetical protein CLU95_5510 [Variovorax sp. 54]|uniref:M48 family metalloprotease n=1 Tax=Variovorax sp. 54 TaxID=2035212 RepID=UPI000C1A3BB8|nr:M48 family metalloprotease [Variovorax sp. 54]PIF78325.1 hypothetical protein CLU95_5510 [Variovorax sp. 54]
MNTPRFSFFPACASIAATFVLTACATSIRPSSDDPDVVQEQALQQSMSLNQRMALQRRLDDVAIPLMEHSAPFCDGDVRASLGAHIASVWSFEKEERITVKQTLHLDDRLAVLWTLDRKQAPATPLRAGDVLLSVGGKPLPAGEKGIDRLNDVLLDAARAKPMKREGWLDAVVQREGQSTALRLPYAAACNYTAITRMKNEVHAENDGHEIFVNSALMTFFPDNRDLAIVLGHELANGVLSHGGKSRAVGIAAGIVDGALGGTGMAEEALSSPFSQQFDAEADYLGLYMVAAAGYDIEGAERIWREFGVHTAGTKKKSFVSAAPTSARRFVAMRRTIAEIQAKKKNGAPLVPLAKSKS